MKTIKAILLICLLGITTQVNAQFLKNLKKRVQKAAERAVIQKTEQKVYKETSKKMDTILGNKNNTKIENPNNQNTKTDSTNSNINKSDATIKKDSINSNLQKNEIEAKRTKNQTLQTFYSTESPKAAILVRVGDVDNLGFGWPAHFDVFCGKNTRKHKFPWKPNPNDYPGTDRIIVGSSFKGKSKYKIDGYSYYSKKTENDTIAIVLKYPKPTIKINDITLQLFVDDFQAPVFKSYFQVSINGKRLPYFENVINSLKQTGPIGKLVTINISPTDFPLFSNGEIWLKIDDPLTGAGDGFAIDFVQLLFNPIEEYNCIGNIKGIVKNEDGDLLDGVTISANNFKEVSSKKDGTFYLANVPTGIISVVGQKKGYSADNKSFELEKDATKSIVLILKNKEKESEDFMLNELKTKGKVDLYGIHFDVNKDIPTPSSKSTLMALYNMLSSKPTLSIVIIGHTDSDASESYNQNLSLNRSKSIVAWLKQKGINGKRLKSKGLGESSPVASNKTDAGKALNRRVEIKLIK